MLPPDHLIFVRKNYSHAKKSGDCRAVNSMPVHPALNSQLHKHVTLRLRGVDSKPEQAAEPSTSKSRKRRAPAVSLHMVPASSAPAQSLEAGTKHVVLCLAGVTTKRKRDASDEQPSSKRVEPSRLTYGARSTPPPGTQPAPSEQRGPGSRAFEVTVSGALEPRARALGPCSKPGSNPARGGRDMQFLRRAVATCRRRARLRRASSADLAHGRLR